MTQSQIFNRLLSALFVLLITGCSFDGTFFPVDERPADAINGTSETISLAATDGASIHHFLFTPPQRHKATIFAFQGSGSKVANWYKVIRPLIDDGYQLFMMEYRGFGKSQGKAGHLSVAQDANNALRYLVGRDDVKSRPLLILGQSYGGQVAINVAQRNPDLVDALIIEGTFTSFSDEAAYSSPWVVAPLVRALLVDPYRAIDLIAEIDVPLLVIHSTDDGIVPFIMGTTLFANARGDKTLWEVKGEHVAALIDFPREYIARINEMIPQEWESK